MAVYDLILFFNEIELLELRMNILNDYVDCFVICESDKTFTNKFKGYILENNMERFQKFLPKIHYIKTTFDFFDPWENESFQRNIISENLPENIKDEDTIIFCDLDEIPNPKVISREFSSDFFYLLDMKMYYFYFNVYAPWRSWDKAKMLKYKLFKQASPQLIRKINYTTQSVYNVSTKVIKNSGWHYSWLGGGRKVIYKIESYSHQEHNFPGFKNQQRIEEHIKNIVDLFEPEKPLLTEEITYSNSPEYLVDNLNKYIDYIYPAG